MTMISVGRESDFELTKDTPYLALTGEVWSVFCEYSILDKMTML